MGALATSLRDGRSGVTEDCHTTEAAQAPGIARVCKHALCFSMLSEGWRRFRAEDFNPLVLAGPSVGLQIESVHSEQSVSQASWNVRGLFTVAVQITFIGRVFCEPSETSLLCVHFLR